MSALRNVLKGKHVCISCRKIIFETYQSALYSCNPECLHFSFTKSRSHTALTLPRSSGRNAPWDWLSMCLRNYVLEQISPENWAWLDGFSCSQNDNSDPGSSSIARPLGWGGVRSCVLRPASFPSCTEFVLFYIPYWCYNTPF